MGIVRIESDRLSAGFDRDTGALVELAHRGCGWRVIDQPELGLSFELLAPRPDRLLHRVIGRGQRLASLEVSDGGRRLQLVWENPLTERGEPLPAIFTASVTASEIGLEFGGEVVNRGDLTIENVAWPVLGQVAPRPQSGRLEKLVASWSEASRVPVWPSFRNEQGYWGADFPMQKSHSPHQPFLLLHDGEHGLYVGHHDLADEELLQFLLELKPGVRDTFGDLVPESPVAGEPVRVQLTLQHFSFVAPGQTRRLTPVVLSAFSGSWHRGADLYRKWRTRWHRPARTPDWCRDVHAWQQVQVNSIAGTQTCRYRDLVHHAEQCARHGVEVIQLTGWTINGQDGWLPSHDIDARLGTWAELKQAIADCRKLGVRVVLYGKFVYADISTPWYRDELHRLMSTDRAGNKAGHAGWAYFLPSHFAEVNMRRLNWACMHHKRWRQICCDEYARSFDLDADGWLLDESCHPRQDGRFCFAADHGHPVPAFNCAGDRLLLRQLNELAAGHPRPQVIACEAAHDKDTLDYGLSYFRIYAGHVPMLRYIDPHYPMLVGLWGTDDREKVNQCLMYRYLISYEPRNFKGYLDEMPRTVEYGGRVDALRRRYRQYLWDATFQDTLGASVTVVGGSPHSSYSVFRDPESGRRAVVVANHDSQRTVEARVTLDDDAGPRAVVTPEEPEPRRLDEPVVSIPPRSVAVLLSPAGGERRRP